MKSKDTDPSDKASIELQNNVKGEDSSKTAPDEAVSENAISGKEKPAARYAGYLVPLLILIFVALFAAQNIAFIKSDTAPKFSDYQMIKALHYYDLFMNDEYNVLTSISYPPLVYVITRSYFLHWGISMETARLSLGIFWVIFLLSMYGIGKEYGDRYSGFAVMLLAAASPHALNYSRNYYLDFPQAATTALAFYLLLKSNSFRNRIFSILFGMAAALSMLTKWSAIFFIILPVIWFLIPYIFRSLKSVAAFLVFLGAGAWWFIKLNTFYRWLASQRDPVQDWFVKYLIIFAIPLIVCAIVILIMDYFWRKNEGFRDSPEYRVINFVYSSIFAIAPAGMWFVYAGKKNADRFFAEVREITDFQLIAQNKAQMTAAVATMFNFLPLLIIAGIVYLFYSKKELYRLLILPVNFTATFFLVVRLATLDRDPSRYIISLIVFSTPFCGYWAAKTGRAKPVIMGIITGLSLLSIFAWTVLPGTLPFYEPVFMGLSGNIKYYSAKILCSEPPVQGEVNVVEPVRNFLKGNRDYDFLLFVATNGDEREKQAFYELIQTEMYKQSKRMGIGGTDFKSVDEEHFYSHWRKLYSRDIPNVVIITEENAPVEPYLKTIKKSEELTPDNVFTYHISKNCVLTLVHRKRGINQKLLNN